MISKNTTAEFMEVDLHADEKKVILELAGFWVANDVTLADLKNGRKKWIRFKPHAMPEVIGELAYHYNRCKNADQAELLDELIDHLEGALLDVRR